MAPMDGLTISVDPEMPDHNHGTTPVGVMPVGSGGLYMMSPVNLYMAGYWLVTLSIVAPPAADASDAGSDAAPPAPIMDTAALNLRSGLTKQPRSQGAAHRAWLVADATEPIGVYFAGVSRRADRPADVAVRLRFGARPLHAPAPWSW